MKILRWLLLVVAGALPAAVLAQAYPVKPVKLVVGFPPGGGNDINGRLLASKLSEYLGQQVIVENRPGAGTNIANEFVARSAPDGYTLLINTAAVAINMALYARPGFDTLRDFTAVSIFSSSPNILVVNATVPFKSVGELISKGARRARQAQLFLGRRRHHPAPFGRVVQDAHGDQTSCTFLTKARRPRLRRSSAAKCSSPTPTSPRSRRT